MRRERLQLRCAGQRDEIARAAQTFLPVFAAADALRAGLDYLKAHPEWVAAAAAAALILRPWGVLRWGRRAFLAWRAWRRLRVWLEAALPPLRRPA
ncbi:MAG: hypothetical protein OHK0026_13740 [Rhodocyclaceae bacterium]